MFEKLLKHPLSHHKLHPYSDVAADIWKNLYDIIKFFLQWTTLSFCNLWKAAEVWK